MDGAEPTPPRVAVLAGTHPGGLVVTLKPHPLDWDAFHAALGEAAALLPTALAAAETLFRKDFPAATEAEVAARVAGAAATVRAEAPRFRAEAERLEEGLLAALAGTEVARLFLARQVALARAASLEGAGR